MVSKTLFSSDVSEWETPKDLFDKYNRKFGFTLDAAASDTNFKCLLYFTKETNGLVQPWSGHRVWCNPPYGREVIQWVEKANTEAALNDVLTVMLLPSRTDTRWYHCYCKRWTIEYLPKRLRFVGAKHCAPFPSMVVYFGI